MALEWHFKRSVWCLKKILTSITFKNLGDHILETYLSEISWKQELFFSLSHVRILSIDLKGWNHMVVIKLGLQVSYV